MTLELTTDTAPTARALAPEFLPLASAQLSPSRTASALSSLQERELLLIDATSDNLADHIRSIASFAETIETLDADLGARLTW